MIDINGYVSKLSWAEKTALLPQLISKHRANFKCPYRVVLTDIANDETLTMEERFIVAWCAGVVCSRKDEL